MNRVLLHVALTSLLLVGTRPCQADVNEELKLAYSGRVSWEPTTATLTFETSGTMPPTREGFYWDVPDTVAAVVIAKNTRVTGGFRVGYREASNPLKIEGHDRKSSAIYGTATQRWTREHRIPESEKWKYGAINALADSVVHVANLTIENPRSYCISGYANRSIIHVSRCDLLDTRPGDNNNSDGFIGSAGSTIRDSFISTGDDGIKAYHDLEVANVTIEQHRNGAPLQFGWGGEDKPATIKIRNLTIRGVDADGRYNMAPMTWEAGESGHRDVTIDQLKVKLNGYVYAEEDDEWRSAGLLEIKPSSCTFNLNVTDARLDIASRGYSNAKGRIVINGEALE